MTQAQADGLGATAHPDAKAENRSAAKPDRTHLNDKGNAVFGRMVADSVIRTEGELGPNVKGVCDESGTSSIPQPSADSAH